MEMQCTEEPNGEFVCKISANENGKKATCDLKITEAKNGAGFTLSCSGDPDAAGKIQNSDMFLHKDGKDFHLQK